jgi:hypothetical protein
LRQASTNLPDPHAPNAGGLLPDGVIIKAGAPAPAVTEEEAVPAWLSERRKEKPCWMCKGRNTVDTHGGKRPCPECAPSPESAEPEEESKEVA